MALYLVFEATFNHRDLSPPSPLIAVRAFDAFSRSGSIRAAADLLAISHTVVSRHIQNLEDAVGTRLVKKDGRGLAFSAKASASPPRRGALDLIADASGELVHGQGRRHPYLLHGASPLAGY